MPNAQARVLKMEFDDGTEYLFLLPSPDDREKIIGSVQLVPDPDVLTAGELASMWIDPQFRRQRYGRKLYERVEDKATLLGIEWLRVHVHHGNAEAWEFWRSLGFEELISGVNTDNHTMMVKCIRLTTARPAKDATR